MVEHDQDQKSVLRRVVPFMWVAILVAVVYVGWTFYARHQEGRELERKAAEKTAADNRMVAEAYGGNRLEILNFTAAEATVKRGEKTRLCYSVSNAKKVTIVPDVNEVRPSYSNCVEATVSKDTTYTLTAEDDKGNAQSATLTIHASR